MNITTLTLRSNATQAAAPFTVGHCFKKGDVPAGSQVVAQFPDFQCVPKNVWSDGSLKIGILSGRAAITAGADFTAQLSTGVAAAGTDLTTADLKATGVIAAVSLTNSKDWTFDTAAQTVGASLSTSSLTDIVDAATAVTVDNSAVVSNYARIAGPANDTLFVMTASISGGVVAKLQKVQLNLKFKVSRNIAAIAKGVTTRVTPTQSIVFQGSFTNGRSFDQRGVELLDIGNTFTFSGISGMTELNGMTGTVTAVGPLRAWFEVNINSTNFGTYTSGGVCTKNQLNNNYADVIAYVKPGGGIQWNGTINTYSPSNSIGDLAVTWSGTDWDAPFETWFSGPRASSWRYRKAVGTDAHLVAWLEVTLYKNGEVEILPWLENGYVRVPGPTNKLATYDFSINGVSRCAITIDLKHHTRTPIINGTALSYWKDVDPGIKARHNSQYMQSTELVPSYSAVVSPTGGRASQLAASYVPFQASNLIYDSDFMPSTGYQAPIGLLPEHDVLYLTTDAANGYGAVVRNGFSAGRYSSHYRDENTLIPIRFIDYPNLCLLDSIGYRDNGTSTKGDYVPYPTNGNGPTWDTPHCPFVGYMAYLVTGRKYFLEELQFAVNFSYLGESDNAQVRIGSQALMRPATGAIQSRSFAWNWRNRTGALTITPDNEPTLRNEYIRTIQNSIDYHHSIYIAQPNNPWGFMLPGGTYGVGSDAFHFVAPWQENFITASWGWSLCREMPLSSAHTSKFLALFQWKAKSAILTLGPADKFWYVNPAPYLIAISPSSTTLVDYIGGTGPWLQTEAQIYAETYSTIPTNFSTTEGVLQAEYAPDSWVASMLGNLMPAISYAVRHGIPGALAGYNRLTNATNWPQVVTNFNLKPVWSVKPQSIGVISMSTPGPSFVWDSASLIAGAFVWDTYRGLGIPAADIPAGSFLANDVDVNDPAGTEYRMEILTGPSVGILDIDNKSGFEFTPPNSSYEGVATGAQRVFKNGDPSDTTFSFTNAAVAVVVPTTPTVTSVSLSPVSGVGNTTFAATVAGTNSPAQTVMWSLTGPGTLVNGVYTAPAATTSTQTATVKATSTVDPTKFSTAVVTTAAIGAPAATVSSVSIAPSTASGDATFVATVNGANLPPQTVTWSLTGPGTLVNGVYTAPAATSVAQTATIKATSTFDTSKFGTATVTIAAAGVVTPPNNNPVVTGVSISPTSATGDTTFAATVQGTNSPSQAVIWSKIGGGTLVNGVFTAPARNSTLQTISITATSAQDTNKSATAVVTIAALPAGSVVVAPNRVLKTSADNLTLLNGATYDTFFPCNDGRHWGILKDSNDSLFYARDVGSDLAAANTSITSVTALVNGVTLDAAATFQGTSVVAKIGGGDPLLNSLDEEGVNFVTFRIVCANGEQFDKSIYFDIVNN